MTASEEVNCEANNGENQVQEGKESVDKKEQKSDSEPEKIESLSVNEPGSSQESNEIESEKQKGSDGKEKNNKPEKKNESPLDLVIRMTGFTKLQNETEELKVYYNFFTQEIGISAPLVEMSTRLDDSVIFKLKSEDDKAKLYSKIKKRRRYKWKNYVLELKGLPNISLGKKIGNLPLDKALEILFPHKEIPYGKQLKEKAETSKNVINSILTKKDANVMVKEIVPMTSIEGYDYHVPLSIEEEPETNRIIYGIRVTSADRKNTCVVPIELCPNVPHQITLVAKDFVDHMAEFSFTPFNQKTSEGNISGIALYMSNSGNFIMTIIVPTIKLEQFKQLTPNGVDGDVVTIENFSKTNETRESLIEKADKYFNSRGKDCGIMSIYLSSVSGRLGLSWNTDGSLPQANHILGDSSIPNYCNGQQFQMSWTKEYLINNSVMAILNVIQEKGYIYSYSSICLVCIHKFVPLYLANKVDKLSVLCSPKRGNLIMLRAWAKKMGLNKVEFIDIKGINRFKDQTTNTTAIIWHTIKKYIVDILLASGVTNIIFISYWTKDPSSEFIKTTKNQLESISQKLEISNIFPIDIAPYTDRFCLLIFFHAKKHLLTRKRSYDSLERLQPYYESEYDRTKRLKATYF